MKINENSWHVRFNEWVQEKTYNAISHYKSKKSLCSYFWHTIFNFMFVPFLIFLKLCKFNEKTKFISEFTTNMESHFIFRKCKSRSMISLNLILYSFFPYIMIFFLLFLFIMMGIGIYAFYQCEYFFTASMILLSILGGGILVIFGIKFYEVASDNKNKEYLARISELLKSGACKYRCDADEIYYREQKEKYESSFRYLFIQFMKSIKNKVCPIIEFYNPEKEEKSKDAAVV